MKWLNEYSRMFLNRGYLIEGQTPEQRIEIIANAAEKILGIKGFAKKFLGYMEKGYYSLSTPVWSNFGNDKGLPISCFGSYIEDNMGSILYTLSEVGMMSKFGGGTSGYFGSLRPRGAEITNNGHSSGSVHFMKLFETAMDVISQGCYDDQTEVLTEKGWKKFEELIQDKTIKVAQVTDNDTVEFVLPLDYIKYKPQDNELLHFKDSRNIDLLVTKNHNMVFKRECKIKDKNGKHIRYVKPEYYMCRADQTPLHRDIKYAHASYLPNTPQGLTAKEKLLIAFQADGYACKNYQNGIKFRFKKKRKVERLIEILKESNINYTYTFNEKDKTHNIYFNIGEKLPKTFVEWVDITNKSVRWAEEFINEVALWDGNIRKNGLITYDSTIESNVDIVQMIGALCGYKTTKYVNEGLKEPNKTTIYRLTLSKGQYFSVEKLRPTTVKYDGYVYCVEVPSHKLIVRRNGRTLVCGNSTRRGKFAPYLPIDHPDIEEFLQIGTEGFPIQDLTHGVLVPDYWMEEMIAGDSEKRAIWAKVLQRRVEIGYPYIVFIDTVNKNTVDVYKDRGLKIYQSNLCSEIALPNNEEWSFVCNLSSMNLLHYDEWKNTDAVETMVFFLDAVITEFIEKLEEYRDSTSKEKRQAFEFMKRTYNFAKSNRALGLGALGWHSYLQSKMIPFESMEARKLNAKIFSTIQMKAYEASKELAERYGEPEILKGYGRRNTTLTAIAPTTSSAFILGQVSQSIEPMWSNIYVKDVAKMKVTIKNPYLEKVLESYGQNTREVWNNIRNHDGSVQHLDFLTEHEKDVFKTFSEIDQYIILDQASTRQLFIDQSQSLNLMINPKMSAKEINELYIFAWQNGIKSLYYQHSTNAAQQFSKDKLCTVCEA